MGFLTRLVINALALWLTVLLGQKLGLPLKLQPGINGAVSAIVVVIVLAIVNATIGLILKLITAPLNCITLGLVSILINGLLFFLVGQLGLGFYVGSFIAGLFGSIVMGIISSVATTLVAEPNRAAD